MATKLKHLKVKKVDVVDDGANPDAHIMLYKRRDPDAGTGGSAGDGEGGEKQEGILKRLAAFIAKAAGMEEDEADSAVGEIRKGEFSQRLNEMKNRRITDEIWDICYALQASLSSIMNDDELDNTSASAAMIESLTEFEAVVCDCITQWSEGRVSGIVQKGMDTEAMKSAIARLTERIEKAGQPEETAGSAGAGQTETGTDMEGENEMGLRIDKSKMSPAERAFYDAIEKRYGVDDGAEGAASAGDVSAQAQTPPVDAFITKGAASAMPAGSAQNTAQAGSQVSVGDAGAVTQQGSAGDDIYKGMHPAVRAELEQLKKFREEAEDRELAGIAKKYEIIGKKAEELVPLFKSLRSAGGTAYTDMIAVLDQAVDAVEKSGVFTEIGKSGGYSAGTGAAEGKIQAIAKGYMEKDPALDYSVAIAKAWENNPDLMAEYEEEAGF